jgi:hypothetical protein
MKSVGSHGIKAVVFMVKVMVWYFVSDTHKVMTTLILGVLILVFSGIDLTAAFGLLLWAFPCSLRDNFYQLWCLNVLCSRHEVDMTVRLVVHYKGLNMGMVRRSLICPFNTLCLSHHVRYIWWNCVQLFWLTWSSLKMVAFTGLYWLPCFPEICHVQILPSWGIPEF